LGEIFHTFLAANGDLLPFREISFIFNFYTNAEAPYMLDPLEIKILESLNADSKQPRKGLAQDLGITESSLSKRIKKLTDAGVIQRFTVDVDFKRIGFGVTAMTLIKEKNQNQSSIEALAKAMGEIPYATHVYLVAGEWDMSVIWCCRSNEELRWCISHLLDNPDVDNIKTEILLSEFKNSKSGLLSTRGGYENI